MGNYSSSLSNRIHIRGPKVGFCVICGEHGKLSRDHVPPKGCNNFSETELRFLTEKKNEKRSFSQGGTHFRSICEACNSKRLGAMYDPDLINWANEISSSVKLAFTKRLSLPRDINIWIKPQKIGRAVVGHLLAAASISKTQQPSINNPMDKPLREYFLNPKAPFPESYELYYWPYPYRPQVVVKYFGKMNINTKTKMIGHTLKFPPLGFMLSYKNKDYRNLNIPKLIEEKDMGLDEPRCISLDLSSIPEQHFPEFPYNDEMMLYNERNGFIAHQKPQG